MISALVIPLATRFTRNDTVTRMPRTAPCNASLPHLKLPVETTHCRGSRQRRPATQGCPELFAGLGAGGAGDTRNAVVLAASHASQVFAAVLSSLRGVESIRQDVLEDRIKGREAVARLLNAVRGNDAVIHSVGWTDETGLQIGRSSDGPLPPQPVDMSRREHFLFHRDTPKAAAPEVLHISRPIQARATGEWLLIASIRLEDGQGRFAGVAGAALDPLYFVSIYRSIELGPSRVATLYHSDGIILSRVPDMAAWIGKAAIGAPSLLRDRVSQAPSGTFREEGTAGSVARIVSYMVVPDLPLVVTVSLSLDDALVPFYRGLRITIPAVALVLLFLAGAAWFAELRACERQRSRAALEASEERYRALTELSPAGVFRTDADGNCTYVNARWCTYAGLPPAEALGKGWSEPLHPDDRVTWLFGRAAAVADADGRTIGYIGTVTDTTAYKQVEEALRRSQKMEVVGQLTGGIAHDFNNLLGIMLVNAELLTPVVSQDAKARRYVEALTRTVHRGAELTRKLLRFSRTQPEEPKRVTDQTARQYDHESCLHQFHLAYRY
jgi:PAS domain-containing protein